MAKLNPPQSASGITLENLNLSILSYGASGTGKTHFISSFPKPVYVFDFDGGILTLRGKEGVFFDNYQNRYRNGVKTNEPWKDMQARLTEIESNPGAFATVAIDSITTVEQRVIEEICALTNKGQPSQRDWGTIIKWLIRLFERLALLPCHTIITAHELTIKDEVTGGTVTRPSVSTRKLPQRISVYFDEVYRHYADQTTEEFFFHTRPQQDFDAKSRLGLPNPCTADFAAIHDHIAQEMKGASPSK